MRMRLRVLRAVVAVSVAALILGVLAGSGSQSSAQVFEADTTFSLSNVTPGAVADTTSSISVPADNLNLGGGSGHIAPQATLHPGGSAPALGDIVGTSSSTSNLGLSNLGCGTSFANPFVLMNAVPNDSAGNIDVDLNPPAGGTGKLAPLMADNGAGADGTPAAQSPVNELPGQVDRYPAFLETQYNGVFPDVRYAGALVVSNTAVTINVLTFGPGDLSAFAAPNPLYDLAPARMGYATQVVLGDPTTPPVPSPITDLCAPITNTSTLFGNTRDNPCLVSLSCTTTGQVNTPCPVTGPGNCASLAPTTRIRYQNPSCAAATTECVRLFFGIQFSQRDSDNDGIENSLDTCPNTATTSAFDPRTTAPDGDDDPDSDALPGGGPAGGCDPTPAVNTNSGNHDGDTFPANGEQWVNAGENCPLVANGDQAETEVPEPDNIARPRGGPPTDGLGDACDGPEVGADCTDAVDDDADGLVNDGCPAGGVVLREGVPQLDRRRG